MHPYLIRLRVRQEVQAFFEPYYTSNRAGNLVFTYCDGMEHFGFSFHRVPVTAHFWMAGNTNLHQVRQVLIGESAMELMAYLHFNWDGFSNTHNLLFLAAGLKISAPKLKWISDNFSGKTITLIFSKDILGRVADLKIAAGIRRVPVAITLAEEKIIKVDFRFRQYDFQQNLFSLNAFEKAAKYRFNMSTHKPEGFDSFFDQLKAGAFPNT